MGRGLFTLFSRKLDPPNARRPWDTHDMKRVAVVSLLLMLALVAGRVPPLRAEEKALPPAELVRRLGSPAYPERQDAAVRLARLGREAVPALRDGLRDPDPEVRRRCEDLLPRAQRSDLDIQLDSFLADGPGKQPLPGWTRFKEFVGDDDSARRLFADLYRSDRAVLEQLEKDPKPLAAQATSRCQQLMQKLGMPRGGDAEAATPGHIAALLLSVAVAPSADMQSFYQIYNVCHQPPVRALILGQPAARRLMSRALAPKLADPNGLNMIANLANALGLTELLDEKIKPAVRTQIETIKPDDWRFQQAVYLANQLQMHDLIETRIKPAVRALAENALRRPDHQGHIYQAINLVQVLNMKDIADNVLKPAALQYLKATAEQPGDLNRIYQSRYLSQTLGLSEAFDVLVKPAACRVVAEAAAHPDDQSKFQQALNLAQALNLEEAYEGVLRPAGRRRILADLEQPGDLNRLFQAAQLARQLRLADTIEDTLKPLARRRAATLLDQAPDANRINQVHILAQMLGMPELNEDVVKPALRKLCQAARDRPLDAGAFPQTLNLIKSLRIKEAVPLLLQGALAKEVHSWARGSAILALGKVGTKEDVARLEPLLKDTTNCGACGINSTTIQAELRDVALAVMIFSNGQNLADYGFPYFRLIPGVKPTDLPPGCLGFANNTDRAAAVKKWQEWSASGKK
jgi:hypothetical protein